jgi:hypothetical protein
MPREGGAVYDYPGVEEFLPLLRAPDGRDDPERPKPWFPQAFPLDFEVDNEAGR